ncbi:MAG: diol dehydratase reactivase subunit alpha, partial [Blautia sp.]|nr:diol dehydratase reactivase subunit alpha [Blautia sp.]
VKEQMLPAGSLTFVGEKRLTVPVDEGAEAIMRELARAGEIKDIQGEEGTNIGEMLSRIRRGMEEVSQERDPVRITDILAVDTLSPVPISGALAGETCLEKAVGIAAMVRTHALPMRELAGALSKELSVETKVGGVEAVMASLGAFTTPGTTLPLAILDMGGGSTDAAILYEDGRVVHTHQAGAGELVTMLIQLELGLGSRYTAEQIKKYPLGKVESLFHLRLETGQVQFFEEPLDPRYYGHVVLLPPSGELLKIDEDLPLEKILSVRREAKKKVFVVNATRALTAVAPGGDIKKIPNVVLVGGSAEDFEIPEMLMEAFSQQKIVCGRGNIRGKNGPRGAVAAGLLMSYVGEKP